jgi:hypothetical protein
VAKHEQITARAGMKTLEISVNILSKQKKKKKEWRKKEKGKRKQ